jgi:hypothetical protein
MEHEQSALSAPANNYPSPPHTENISGKSSVSSPLKNQTKCTKICWYKNYWKIVAKKTPHFPPLLLRKKIRRHH